MCVNLYTIKVQNYSNYNAKIIVSNKPIIKFNNKKYKKLRTSWIYIDKKEKFKSIVFNLVSLEHSKRLDCNDFNKLHITLPTNRIFINIWLYNSIRSFHYKCNKIYNLPSNINIIRTY